VAGHAVRMPLLPAEPLAAANRRVAITLLRQAPAPGGSGADAPPPPAAAPVAAPAATMYGPPRPRRASFAPTPAAAAWAPQETAPR
jgi:hypothetical protein